MNQTELDWPSNLLSAMQQAGITADTTNLAEITVWTVDSQHWENTAALAKSLGLRWAAGWAEHQSPSLVINALLTKPGRYLLLRTRVEENKATLPSQAWVYFAANRSERHTQDMFGIDFSHHPDNRPWIRHRAWEKRHYPLRHDFPATGEPQALTPPDLDYQFVKARGPGVYEIPVGPVHAGIIEPGHFRFQAVGETILHLEERLGYVHKGIEKIATGRTPAQLNKLAGRVSGDSTVAHSWAACRAMEQAVQMTIPVRAAFIRGIMLERERIANHLGDIGAICNDVGFAFAHMQFGRLRELWVRAQQRYFGHRLMMDCILPGGVQTDITMPDVEAMQQELKALRKQLDEILPAIDLNSSLEDRLYTTGHLAESTASALGALGYVGRSSGQDIDARRDAAYPPYDQLMVNVVVENQGDVASRMWVRVKEIFASVKLIRQMLQQLPDGLISAPWATPAANAEGIGIVEGWRGEIVSYVRFGNNNQIARYYPRDPSLLNWPALEKLILNDIVPDFPVCNKSVNASYSAHDL